MESRRLIARNLKRIRLLRRLSQEGLALQAGVDRTYVSGLERGLRNPSVDILDRLGKVLLVKTAEFLSEDAADLPPALPRGRREKLQRKPMRS